MSVIVCTARSAWLALLLSFGLVAGIHAQPTPPYQAAPPSADGIGKVYAIEVQPQMLSVLETTAERTARTLPWQHVVVLKRP